MRLRDVLLSIGILLVVVTVVWLTARMPDRGCGPASPSSVESLFAPCLATNASRNHSAG